MIATSVEAVLEQAAGAIHVHGDHIHVLDENVLRQRIDGLIYTAVFGKDLARDTARWLIWEAGLETGLFAASIHELYMAVGRGDLPHVFTVPAINVRAMTYNTARAVFRAARELNVGAMIFEIARSEMGYTDQRPAEYVASIMAAGIKEGFRGPLYIQGDHFQISRSRYESDPETEVEAVKELMREAVGAGFYNIDIDTSTLVDLSFPTLDEQQETNYTLCAGLTEYVRTIEPEGVTVSLGGEIGEVGHKNSTVEELHAFMQGYRRTLSAVRGISKISVQTGTSHGGVVLPDGSLAQVKVDFETLRDLSQSARDDYGLGGAVQHGASTLPPSAFGKFPEIGTLEIHLATNFQNMIYDNLPQELVDEAYQYLHEHHKGEWKEGKSEDQFIYSARKRAIGPFKRQWWDMDASTAAEIGGVLQEQFAFLFEKLNVSNTRDYARSATTRVDVHRPRPLAVMADARAEDVSDLAD